MKILVIQLAKMGDIIQSFPLCDALYSHHPDVEISFLHSEIFSETLHFRKFLKPVPVNLDLLTIEENGFLHLTKNHYTNKILTELNQLQPDVIYNLNSSQPSAEICSLLNCSEKHGFKSGNEYDEKWLTYILSFMKSRHLGSINLVDIFLKLINGVGWQHHTFTLNEQDCRTNILNDDVNRNNQICLQLGSRNSKRHPQMRDYAQIANTLIDNGYQIVLTGVKSEISLFESFIPFIHKPYKIINRIGQTSLSELRDLLDQSDYLISSDTGTMHLASLTRCKIFAIFMGCAYPYETLVYNNDTVVYFPDHDAVKCYPCNELTPCPNRFICKEFNPEIVCQYILCQIKHPSLYVTIQDNIGQYLIPSVKHDISDYQLMALIWRLFSADYFYKIELYLSDYDDYFIFHNDQTERIHKLISRELSLFKLSPTELSAIHIINENYLFLSPLLIFKLLWNEDQLAFQTFEKFLQKILF